MLSFFDLPHFRPLLGAAVLFAAANSHGESKPAPLTLVMALQRAAETNPALAVQHYSERAAAALVEQAGVRPNPTLDVSLENFAGTGRLRGADELETTVQATQTFERGGKRAKRVAAAERDHEIAGGELAVHRTEVLAATASAYIETLAAQQRVALAAEPLRLAQETLTAIEARVQAGAASPAETARARASLAAARADHARAESMLVRARATLATMWGGRVDEVLSLDGTLRVPATLPSEEPFRAGLAQHARFGLQQAVIASRRASLDLAQAQAVPDITVGGGVRFLRANSDAAFVAGLSVPLPVRHKNQGNIRAARETLAGAEQSVALVETKLQAAFTAAWQDLASAHASALALRREALPATEEAYAHVRRAYQEGHLPLIDVLDAQRAFVALRREVLETEAAYALALARIEGLTTPAFPHTTALLSSP